MTTDPTPGPDCDHARRTCAEVGCAGLVETTTMADAEPTYASLGPTTPEQRAAIADAVDRVLARQADPRARYSIPQTIGPAALDDLDRAVAAVQAAPYALDPVRAIAEQQAANRLADRALVDAAARRYNYDVADHARATWAARLAVAEAGPDAGLAPLLAATLALELAARGTIGP